jgi:hypothetical protein
MQCYVTSYKLRDLRSSLLNFISVKWSILLLPGAVAYSSNYEGTHNTAQCKWKWNFCYRGNFMFLKPSLSEMSIIYTLPFSRSVWITYALIVAVLTVALVISIRTEQSMTPSEHYHPVRWSDAALNSVGIVCQQGMSLVYYLNKCALLSSIAFRRTGCEHVTLNMFILCLSAWYIPLIPVGLFTVLYCLHFSSKYLSENWLHYKPMKSSRAIGRVRTAL